jgi:hypothetical protein
MVALNRNSDLPDVVDALCPPCGLARSLNGRKQERDKNPNDRDYYQQLDERKTVSAGFPTPNIATGLSFNVSPTHVESIIEMNRLSRRLRQIPPRAVRFSAIPQFATF